MCQFTDRGLAKATSLMASAATALVCGCWAGILQAEPQYWAGDISFVTQASYVEEAPPAAPDTSMQSPATSTSNDPWPAASSSAHSAAIEPQPLAVEPRFTAPAQRSTPNRPPIVSFSGQITNPAAVPTPQRMPIQPAVSPPAAQSSKPFENTAGPGTISPYLNLFREDTDAEVLPNYYAFVRPQLEQREANRRQQQELQQLERQMQGGPMAAGASMGTANSGTRRLPGRFMNTAQFYSGWQQ